MNPFKRTAVFGLVMALMFLSKSIWAAEVGESWLDHAAKPIRLKEDEATLKIGVESRYRFETRDNFNLNDQSYEDDAVNLFRNRLNADLKLTPEVGGSTYRFFVEGQAAQSIAGNGLNKTNLFVNHVDLRQLFLEINKPFGLAPLTVKAGRQELAYGDERFVGPLNWTNTARVFDAVKLIYTPVEWLQIDAFGSRVVRNEPTTTDRSAHADNFYGVYAAYKKIPDHTLDTFLFVRDVNDNSFVTETGGVRGDLTEYTLGNRFKGKTGPTDYGTEYAIQFGKKSDDTIRAWAFHQELGYTLTSTAWTPRLYTEYNHASGDRNTADDEVGTFDNLYPTNHNKYGLIDFVSLKNINDFMIGASVKPDPKLLIASEFHWFLRDGKESAWFNASGGVYRAANVAAAGHLGNEIDVYASYPISPYLSSLIGYSHFFAGPFAEDTGRSDDADFFYAQLTFKV